MSKAVNVIWFRSDLRLFDNTALSYLTKSLTSPKPTPILAPFIISKLEWTRHNMAPIRIRFMMESLAKLKKCLNNLGIPLVVKQAPGGRKSVPGVVAGFVDEVQKATQVKIEKFVWNMAYEVHECERDARVESLLKQYKIEYKSFHDQCIIPPGVIRNNNNEMPTVFTPFFKLWLAQVKSEISYRNVNPAPPSQKPIITQPLYTALAQLSMEIPTNDSTLVELTKTQEETTPSVLHEPLRHQGHYATLGYPLVIVDHFNASKRVVEHFKRLGLHTER